MSARRSRFVSPPREARALISARVSHTAIPLVNPETGSPGCPKHCLLCQGHNRCYALAPEVFDVDDYGNAVVRGDGTVPPELEDKARLAIGNCPEYAISIVEGT
jgi:ferredoxin